ncbi:MAG: tRNA (N(6)-L-threonylcarbamoyladenosine(37)-C(2))-methylthiotransferase MtaB [Oscillospiraceae bacterium]|nr:tRNA (N(6)-L-threonylcarbamoyladenosine(37)-C(2))-methylthiotransferase MtaB [Oscillospiraceae bacterium]
MRFYVETLGCKVNQAESLSLESVLISRGHILAEPGRGCDICIINTCAVTAESARKSRQTIRRLKKLEPSAKIAVCGCLSALEPESAAQLGADIISGAGDKSELVNQLEQLAIDYEQLSTVNCQPSTAKTRALLKIQDGCDNFCAYCVIPYARGAPRSLPIELAVEQAREIQSTGFREIVVTGIEISSYGKDLSGEETLVDVVRAIGLAAPDARLRLGSIDPAAVTEDFCCKLASGINLCDHFHLSLQSGCDETLRRMGRKYNTDAVAEAILCLRGHFPDCGITADLITGFPGESDVEFAQTLEFIKSAKFSDMHIFPFSPRQQTRAASMSDQVEKKIRRERARIAAAVAREMSLEFKRSQIGKTLKVLIERESDGFSTGYAGNYLEVRAENGGEKNSMHVVQIQGVEDELVWG